MIKSELLTSPGEDKKFLFESEKVKLEIEDILDHCYKIDENVKPSTYRLLDLDAIIPGFENENSDENEETSEKIESQIENALKNSNMLTNNFLDKSIYSFLNFEIKRR